MVGRNDIVFSGYKSQKTTEQEGTEKNRARKQEKKEEKNKPKKRKERMLGLLPLCAAIIEHLQPIF